MLQSEIHIGHVYKPRNLGSPRKILAITRVRSLVNSSRIYDRVDYQLRAEDNFSMLPMHSCTLTTFKAWAKHDVTKELSQEFGDVDMSCVSLLNALTAL